MSGHASSSAETWSIRIAETREQVDRCFQVMRQLRPQIEAAQFAGRIETQQREGYRLACLEVEGAVAAVAGFRVMHVLWSGKTMYVDDLVTDEAMRSRGLGEALLRWLMDLGRREGCDAFSLDSGTDRHQAHAFYFRQGLRITDFH